jgi:outer membrane protein OmpA-like peptidoglycan-associated protein
MSRLALIGLCGLMMTGCASIKIANPRPSVTMGDNVCGREAVQIYFSSHDDQLSITAAQVVSELSNKLARCTRKKVYLIAISGNDGSPATPVVAANRVKVVGDILISQGLAPSRILAVTDGPLVDAMPRGPIGGVVVLTRR